MKKHRCRAVPSTDANPLPHTFVELEKDSWLEVDSKAAITHSMIHATLKNERKTRIHTIRYETRAFNLFASMREYTELQPIH